MIELFEQDIKTYDRQSSKGNQLKWENSGIWYKADFTGYEGLAEYMISHLLKKSTLLDDEYVVYDLEQIKYKNNIYNGVESKDFLKEGWQIITLERLYKYYYGESISKAVFDIADYEDRLTFLVNQTERITGLKNFGEYLGKLFTIDAFFLNEDRHMHNIAVLMSDTGQFAICPIFDNGASLLADTTMDYPLGEELHGLIKNVKSKTICTDFDEQLDIVEKKYKINLKFSFCKKDVSDLLDKVNEYPQEVKDRVKEIIFIQMRKYNYLFSK